MKKMLSSLWCNLLVCESEIISRNYYETKVAGAPDNK